MNGDETFRYAYDTASTYIATLRVIDNSGKSASKEFTVTVLPAFSPPGNCVRFDGIDDHIIVLNDSILQPANVFTLEAWAYVDSAVHNASVIDNGYATAGINKCGGYNLGLVVDTSMRFGFWACNGTNLSTNQIVVESDSCFDENTWYHLAAVCTGNELILYINGAEQGRSPFSGNIDYSMLKPDTLYGVNIGLFRDDDESNYFHGKLEEVRIWNLERTAREIRSNMCKILSGNENGLQAYFRFDNTGDADILYDYSAHDHFGFLHEMDSSAWIDSEAFNTWNGSVDTIWNKPSNWSDDLPGINDNIGIASSANSPSLSVSDTCRLLAISTGSLLRINTGALRVSDKILNAGTLIVNDSLLNQFPKSALYSDGVVINNGFILLKHLSITSSGIVTINEGKKMLVGED